MKVPTRFFTSIHKSRALAVGAVLAGVAVGFSLSGCGDTPSVAPAAPAPAPTASTGANPGASAPITISIPSGAMNLGSEAFGTNPLMITAGQTVTWTNNDSVTHTVTSDDGVFDSGLLPPGMSFSHTFNVPGTFNYHCNIHTTMTGSIEVSSAASPTPSPSASVSPEPSASPSETPSPNPSESAGPSPSPSGGQT